MNKPLIFIAVSYMLGIISAFVFFERFYIYFFIITGVLLLFLIYILLKKKFSFIIFVLFFSLGIIMFYFQNIYLPENHIKNFKEFSSIKSFDCIIADIPVGKEGKIYFTALLKSVYIDNKKYEGVSGKIRITVEQKFNLPLKYGDIVNIKGKLRVPEDRKNEGEFNYKKYLERKKIFFIVYTDDVKITVTGNKIYNPLVYFAGKVKEKFIICIYKSVPLNEARILEGLLLGNQKAIPEHIYDNFKITGTAHILAVSGMNVGLIAFFIFLFLKFINFPQKISATLILFFIWVFAVITGFDASIVRATVMASFVLFGLIIERDIDLINTLFSSAFLILLFKTGDLFDIGFQLSYLATFGIIYFLDYVKQIEIKLPNYIKEILFATITAQIFIVPVMINIFHQLSIISIIANFFIIPLSSLITMLGFCMWFIFFVWEQGATIFGASIFILIKIMLFFINFLSEIPYAAISVKTLPAFFIFVYYLFFIFLPYDDVDIELKRMSLKKLTGLFLILFLLLFISIPEKKFKFYALSVQDTNCVFVNTEQNEKILILAYDKNKEIVSVRNTIIPFLRNKGINNIDFLILYSFGNEKNIHAFINNFYVKKIITDLPLENIKSYTLTRNINEILSKNTKIFINPFNTEIEFKSKSIIFEKVLTEKTVDKEYIIYACFYNLNTLDKVSKKYRCLINSRNKPFFIKEKIPESKNIFDVKTGMAVEEM